MLEINLLAHREAKRLAEIRESVVVLLLGLVAVGLGVIRPGTKRRFCGTSVSFSRSRPRRATPRRRLGRRSRLRRWEFRYMQS